jgi:flagellar biogenesis protein FliO
MGETTGRRPALRETSDRLSTETKHSTKTTEFFAMIGIIAGILIAAWYVGRNGGDDFFRADKAWLYVSIVASAYMVSRGLAKAGSSERYWADGDRDGR